MTEVHLLDGRIINVWITRGNIQMSLGGEVRELKISEVWDTAALKARAAGQDKALELCVMFLTNVNTIDEEKEVELIKHLRDAGHTDLADAIALRGFAATVGEE